MVAILVIVMIVVICKVLRMEILRWTTSMAGSIINTVAVDAVTSIVAPEKMPIKISSKRLGIVFVV